MSRCSNCRAAARADARFCAACGAPIAAGEPWPSLAVRVRESQRSLSVRFVELARAVCGADLCLVTDPQAARRLAFPDESAEVYGRFSTVCVTRGEAAAALFLKGKRVSGHGISPHKDVPFHEGCWEPVEIHVMDAALLDGALALAAAYKAQTGCPAEVVREF